MNAKHTPGPWNRNIKPARKYPTIYAGRNTHIAVVQSQGLADKEVEANCDLIALSPELLDAVKDCVQWLMAFAKGTGNEIIRETDRYQKYLEVIARAEGGQR